MCKSCTDGVYDHTNKIHLHCYRNKTGNQFIDFLKRIDRRYDDKNIQIIFLVLANILVHKSKDSKEGRDIQMLPENKICISASKISRTQLDCNKVIVVTKTNNKQFYI